MSEWVIYHNAKCSKSRETLALLKEQGVTPRIVSYLEEVPSEEKLKEILKKLQLTAKDIVRTKEEEFKKIKVDLNDDEAVLKMLVKNPVLIERPIVTRGSRAVIGRPPVNVLDLLKEK